LQIGSAAQCRAEEGVNNGCVEKGLVLAIEERGGIKEILHCRQPR
jgi:hypothetical protein